MFYAHVAPRGEDPSAPIRFLAAIPDGRSSVLFALLAGVSLAILTGRNRVHEGQALRTSRLRILGRAVLLLVIAAVLSSLGTYVGIILAFYAAWFVAALPFVRWPARRLLHAAAVVAVVGPLTGTAIEWLAASTGLWLVGDANAFVLQVFVSGNYAGSSYMAFVLAGMGIGRLDLSAPALHRTMVAAGAVVMIVGYLTAWGLTQLVEAEGADAVATTGREQGVVDQPWIDWSGGLGAVMAEDGAEDADVAGGEDGAEDEQPADDGLNPWFPTHPEITAPDAYPGRDLHWDPQPAPELSDLVGAEPHSGTVLETVGSGGCAIMVVGLCLMCGRAARAVLTPVTAIGSMALTSYCGQFLVLAFRKDWVVTDSWGPFALLSVGTMAFALVWTRMARRGPLEWVMWRVSLAAARC